MKKKILIILFLLLFLNSTFFLFGSVTAQINNGLTQLYLFFSEGCPHCVAEKLFLEKLENKYPQIEIKEYEISIPENRQLYQKKGKEYNVPEQVLAIGSVPLTIIGDRYFLGYRSDETTGKEIENYINNLIENKENSCPPEDYGKSVTLFGKEIKISPQNSLFFLAAIFGLADGMNPCMFSVLLMLLAYLLAVSSSKKALRAGIVFGVCVSLIYFSLMLIIYKSLCLFRENLFSFVYPVKMGLGAFLVLIGIWMIKDFFFLKEGQKVSFAIPKSAYGLIKKIISRSTLLAVILLALFSSLVELPCTFALPFGYVTILAERTTFPYPYLILYNLFFVLPLFVIVSIVVFGFSKVENVARWRERAKKIMRLVSGVLLLLFGIAFLLKIF